MADICYNGDFFNESNFRLPINNRAFKYGDSFFETIRCSSSVPLFWEEHYFRIAASFFMMKMEAPDEFNIDYFRDLINLLLIKNKLQNNSARVRISFFRDAGGYYLPQKNTVSFIIESTLLKESKFFLNQKGLSLGLYKENLLPNNILSTIKTNNKILNTLAAIYAKENNYNDVLLMNQNNNLVESISGNIFLIHNGEIITPTLKNGCVDGVMRKVIIEKMNFSIQEKTISLSDLLNAQEIFITNVIVGVQWCEFFKTKKYIKGLVTEINRVLNTLI